VRKWIAALPKSSTEVAQAIVRLLQTLCVTCPVPDKALLTFKEAHRRRRIRRKNQGMDYVHAIRIMIRWKYL